MPIKKPKYNEGDIIIGRDSHIYVVRKFKRQKQISNSCFECCFDNGDEQNARCDQDYRKKVIPGFENTADCTDIISMTTVFKDITKGV